MHRTASVLVGFTHGKWEMVFVHSPQSQTPKLENKPCVLTLKALGAKDKVSTQQKRILASLSLWQRGNSSVQVELQLFPQAEKISELLEIRKVQAGHLRPLTT